MTASKVLLDRAEARSPSARRGGSVLLDSWAWIEILRDSATGRRLRRRYVGAPGVRAHTSVLTLAEIGAKLAAEGHQERIGPTAASLRYHGDMEEVTAADAQAAGPLRALLRKRSPGAGLVDALILATARRLGARLVSADPAFRGLRDVTAL